MGIYVSYSQREKERQSSGDVDVYQYDYLSSSFRSQIVHIWRDAIGDTYTSHDVWNAFASQIGRIVGAVDLFDLANSDAKKRGVPFNYGDLQHHKPSGTDRMQDHCILFLLNAGDVSALDVIELSVQIIRYRKKYELGDNIQLLLTKMRISVDEAIDEINYRFRQNKIGYRIEQDQLIRVDSEVIHKEAVVPALTLLRQPEFKFANDEYRKAHQHYRNGEYKAAILEAENAFESTIKVIASERNWTLPSPPTAGPLIDMCFNDSLVPGGLTLIPGHLDAQRDGVRAMLRGLSVIRNTSGGHGAGSANIDVPEQLAAYALNIAASSIVFLVRQHMTLPR